jgi:hypothetical protein
MEEEETVAKAVATSVLEIAIKKIAACARPARV